MKNSVLTASVMMSLCLGTLVGQIDSQWRGPYRDGIYPEKNLLKAWPQDGPQRLWLAEGFGDGYSSPAVTADRIYITGEIKGEGFLFALDMDGKQVWKLSYGKEWSGSRPGARTTPTVVGDRIYIMSAHGGAVCIDTSGKKVWSVDLAQKFGARNLQWGMTESPLVDGDKVFFTPGGRSSTIVALNRETGETIWDIKINEETSGYCSPCLVRHGQRRLLLTMTAKSLVAIDADSGKFLWRKSHITDYDVNANTPVYYNGRVFTNSGYGTGGQMFQIAPDGNSAEKVWTQKNLDSQMGAVVVIDGYIYGSGHNRRGWHCLNWLTGGVQYSARKAGNKGNIIFADGMLYLYSERGDIALVKPNPEEFELISSFRIKEGSGEHWAHLVIKEGRLYIRHGDSLMVYNISQ
jgi:outer membrane protein assembly factor BamB